jgi:cytoskeletal protein CcmA (bactofilin family)
MFNRKIEADHDAYGQNDSAVKRTNGRSSQAISALLKPGAYNGPVDASYSIINEWLVMRGDLESEADILVKGKIHGNVKCKLLIVDAGAKTEGRIDAEEVIVRGTVKGVISASKVRLEKTASIDCEIEHHVFAAEEGARIKGVLRVRETTEVTAAEDLPALGVGDTGSTLAH